MRKTLWIGLALALAVPVVALAGEMLTVKLREATVRTGPKHFKPVVATVRYGERVEVLSKREGWLEVRCPDGRAGFLHETAVTEKEVPKVAPGSEGTASSSVSRDEVALAGKGFNPQVEQQYRLDHRELEDAFKRVDAMERRKVDRAELDRFLGDGRLGESGRGE